MSGLVHVNCGAVGLVDVVCGAGAPFKLAHGSVAGLYVCGVLGGVVATVLMAKMSSRFRSARGRVSVHRRSSCVTWVMCSVGMRWGRCNVRDIIEKIPIFAWPVYLVRKNDCSSSDLMLVRSTMHRCREVPRMSV